MSPPEKPVKPNRATWQTFAHLFALGLLLALKNLIDDPEYLEVRVRLRKELHRRLANNRGEHVIPYTEKWGPGAHSRSREGSRAASFPESWLKKDGDDGLRDFMYRDEQRLRDQKAGGTKDGP